MTSCRCLVLWTVPRSLSTAVERAWLARGDAETSHEPFTRAYYFGPERTSTRYRDRAPDPRDGYAEIAREILAPTPAGRHRFVKDMAYAVVPWAEHPTLLHRVTSLFLVRDPRRAIPSLARLSVDRARTGWDHFDPAEAGYSQLWTLFEREADRLGRPPPVLDADRLLAAPAEVLRAACAAVDLPFVEGMLTWPPGPVPGWELWGPWHEDVGKSSGFEPAVPRPLPEGPFDAPVEDAIARALPIWEHLRALAL